MNDFLTKFPDMTINLSLLRSIDQAWEVQTKPYQNSDAKLALERCEEGPCKELVDKSSPPIKQNFDETIGVKPFLTTNLNGLGISATTPVANC